MKRMFVFLVLALFLTSSVFANPITSRVIEDEEESSARGLIQAQIQAIKQEAKRIRIQEGVCPEGCDCADSTIKCALEKGGKEMIVTAGNSGDIIIQVKGIESSTNVKLYKSDGKIYGEFNDETKEVRVMPDMVKEKVREKVARELEDEEIKLDEKGIYQYKARKRVKLFGFIRVRQKIRAEINSETGELERIRTPWWSFLARENTELIVGASCGTVSPTSRDECCQNKGYDTWCEECSACEFSTE